MENHILIKDLKPEDAKAVGFANGIIRSIEELIKLLDKGGMGFHISESEKQPVVKPVFKDVREGLVGEFDYPIKLLHTGWMRGYNYLPNLIHWKTGDLVIHDKDAKNAEYLMVVTGFTRDGWVKTRYVNRTGKSKMYTNPMTVLHDPKRFNIPTEKRGEICQAQSL